MVIFSARSSEKSKSSGTLLSTHDSPDDIPHVYFLTAKSIAIPNRRGYAFLFNPGVNTEPFCQCDVYANCAFTVIVKRLDDVGDIFEVNIN